jgi:hypothetical protein
MTHKAADTWNIPHSAGSVNTASGVFTVTRRSRVADTTLRYQMLIRDGQASGFTSIRPGSLDSAAGALSTIKLPPEVTPEHASARTALRREAKRLFGQTTAVRFIVRFDEEDEGRQYTLVDILTDAPDAAAVIDGQETLIELLVSHFPSVEDDFVVLCRRSRRVSAPLP